MLEAHCHDRTVSRDQSMDVARGLAVLAMVWVHFVPEPVEGAAGFWPWLQWASVACLDGLPAAVFVILVGTAWAVGGHRALLPSLRRAMALLLIGFGFWRWFWPNDILMPIAMMMLVLMVIDLLGRRTLLPLLALVLLATPIAHAIWGDYAWSDVRADGTHEANHGFGWATLRYFVCNGAYPLLPWLALPLMGLYLADLRSNVRGLARCLVIAVLVAGVALVVGCAFGDADSGGVHAHLDVTWQPTSLPFLALWGGLAVALITGLMWWARMAGMPAGLAPLAAVGRASLSHYLLHIVVVYGLLRVWWPEEDWPAWLGVLVACAYAAFALIATPRWFARARRGPLEAVLSFCAGRTQR
jgi:uncharacterized protein